MPFDPAKTEINNKSVYAAIVSSMENTQIGDMCCYNNLSKETGNKKYAWKDSGKKFDPSILFNNKSPIEIDVEKYGRLEDAMYMLKRKERLITSSIKEAEKEFPQKPTVYAVSRV